VTPLIFFALALNMKGAALAGDRLVTWGEQILEWSLPDLQNLVLAEPAQPVGEGGCLDSDGRGLFLQEGDKLVYRGAPDWRKARIVDHGIDMHNCAVVTLLGERGVLLTQRGMQVRFYRFPDFAEREVYSFYSASYQAGLALFDVDGDGRRDIFCGNYWIRSPENWKLPWHDFAIELYNQEHDSAKMTEVVEDDGTLTVAQGHLAEGRVAHFRPPSDVKQLWTEENVVILHYPHAAAPGLVAENNGPHSRVFVNGRLAGETDGVHTAFRTRFGYVLVGAESVFLRK